LGEIIPVKVNIYYRHIVSYLENLMQFPVVYLNFFINAGCLL